MIKLKLHKISINFSSICRKLNIEVYQEDAVIFEKLIYKSKQYLINKTEEVVVANEEFTFPLKFEQSFLRFCVFGEVEIDPSSHRTKLFKIDFYSLIPDLNKKVKTLKIHTDKSFKIDIEYDIESDVTKSYDNEKEFEIEKIDNTFPGFMEVLDTTNKFTKKLTPLRRFIHDMLGFSVEKDIKRDIKILILISSFYFYRIFTLFSVVIYLSLNNKFYELRSQIVEKSIRYFYNTETHEEIKKNLDFLTKQQKMAMELLANIEFLVYNKDRKYIYMAFTHGLFWIIAIYFLIVILPGGFILVGGFLAVLGYKYGNDFQKIYTVYRETLNKFEKKVTKFNDSLAKKSRFFDFLRQSHKISKIVVAYEHQRYFVNSGWSTGLLGGSKLKRNSFIL